MDFVDFVAQDDDAGRRLDRILKRLLGERPQSSWQQALRKRLISLNGGRAEAGTRVAAGDRIRVAAFLLTRMERELRLLREAIEGLRHCQTCKLSPGKKEEF